ncbi:MAG: transporter substrate-binding domain-containing protein [Planctomycetaceae bacterium]|nr:transporter substrate-binding domain-containing protein [Planctomycetaceae bacterium]
MTASSLLLSVRCMSWIRIILAGVLFAALAVSAVAAEPPAIRAASELDFRPYCFTDPDGRPVGFGVDLLKAVADKMGMRLEFTPAPWDEVWSGLQSGRFDVLPVVARTSGREPLVDFSLPHTQTFDAFFRRQGQPDLPNLAAAAGKEIVVLQSDAAHHELIEHHFSGKVIPVGSIPEALRLVASGRHDAFLCSKLVGTIEMEQFGISGIEAGPAIPDYSRVFSFAVRKGNRELVEKLNQGLLLAKADGAYDRIYRRWLVVEEPWQRWLPYFKWAVVTLIVLASLAIVQQWLVRRRTRELAQANREIQAEVAQRRKAEALLQEMNSTLERRVAQRTAALRESEEHAQSQSTQLKAVLDAAPAIIWIASDRECRQITGNQAAVEFSRGTDMSRIGAVPEQLAHYRIFHDGVELEPEQMPIQVVARTGRELLDYAIDFHFDDGAVHSLLGDVVPVLDAQGQSAGAIAAFIDVTAHKQAEEQVSRSQKTLSELVDRAPFGIYIIDSRFHIAHMNARSQDGAFRNVRPLIGRDFSEAMRTLWPDPVAAEIIAHFRHTLETGEPYFSPRFTNPRNDEQTVESYEWELHRMTLPDGQYGVVCYYFDSTKLRQAEEALRKAKEELEQRVAQRTSELQHRSKQLASLASELALTEQRERGRLAQVLHDGLQQLLVGAKFRLAVLERAVGEDARKAVSDVSELIDDSIETSRSLTAELSPPILQEGGLIPALEWLVRWMQDKHGLTVDLLVPGLTGPLREDITILLFQATRELLFNVVKHAGVKSTKVRVTRPNGSIHITVSDEGRGFDPGVFGGKDATGGFGLFSISERLGLLGGTIEVDSAPNRGSRFTLIAPASPPAPPSQTQQKAQVSVVMAPPNQEATEGRIRIVLVDDHIVMRQGIASLLRDEKDVVIVGEASDGESAVNLVRELHPDVVLMDISMPGMNGIEATRILHAELPNLPIIGLSMFEQEEQAKAMIDAGAAEYLTKSGPSDALVAAIRKYARRPLG